MISRIPLTGSDGPFSAPRVAPHGKRLSVTRGPVEARRPAYRAWSGSARDTSVPAGAASDGAQASLGIAALAPRLPHDVRLASSRSLRHHSRICAPNDRRDGRLGLCDAGVLGEARPIAIDGSCGPSRCAVRKLTLPRRVRADVGRRSTRRRGIARDRRVGRSVRSNSPPSPTWSLTGWLTRPTAT